MYKVEFGQTQDFNHFILNGKIQNMITSTTLKEENKNEKRIKRKIAIHQILIKIETKKQKKQKRKLINSNCIEIKIETKTDLFVFEK